MLIIRFFSSFFIAIFLIGCSTVHENHEPSGPLLSVHSPDTLIKNYKSISGNVSTSITFHNKTTHSVDIYWIDYGGNTVYYNSLEPNKFYTQQTYLTHPWLVKDTVKNVYIAGYLPAETSALARIK